MISSTSPLSFLLYTYHNVSLDPNKKKCHLLIRKKYKIDYISNFIFYFIIQN